MRDQLAAMTERASTAEVRAAEIERRIADLKTDRDQARMDAGQARDEAARLRGQNEAMQLHQAELMRTITARDARKAGASPQGKAKLQSAPPRQA